MFVHCVPYCHINYMFVSLGQKGKKKEDLEIDNSDGLFNCIFLSCLYNIMLYNKY